ncbi:MFS transporter [Microbacterium kyungheense]|uniref:Putative MFS family arabinose efflux permease n=1 Tax=Microbacterium kyungheense TaxID=1263636 RepID=A0A543F194_9MICO|nr:MFS transporter [Microbacterium kyungheense]TQM27594.1 putative MFS family arabinose efflux permease [Microbacterium kyungheense]
MTGTTARRGLRLPLAWSAPGFPRLAGAWVATNLGDSALYLMIAVWVKELTGSDIAAGFVFVALGVPAILAPFIGMMADRMPRRRLLVINNAVLVPVLLSLLLVSGAEQLWLVYAVMVVYSAAGYVTGSAQSGIIRAMLRDDQLASGNGVLSTIDNALRLVSPLIGTALYVWLGAPAVIVATAACFGVAAVVVAGLPVGAAAPVREARRGYFHELAAGFVQLFSPQSLRVVTIAVAIGFGATGLLNIVVFPALDAMHADPAAIGVLVPIQGAGAVLGGVLSATLVTRWGEGRTAALGLLLVAAGSIPWAFGSVVAGAAGMFVLGLGIPLTVVAFATLRQRLTPDALQGRTGAAANVVINVPQTLASVVGAALLAVVDFRVLIWVSVVAVVLGAATALLARRVALVQPAAA